MRLVGCDPANRAEILVHDRWASYPVYCDISGDATVAWLMRYPDPDGNENMRVIATGTPYLELSGSNIPWEFGITEGSLMLEVYDDPDAVVPIANYTWTLRLLEPLP